MALTYYAITGNGYLPDGVTSEAGQWRIRLAQGYALDGSDWRADEQRFDVAADGSCPGLAAPGLPATTGTQVYSATFVSASGRVVMGPYTFTLTAAKTFADILSEPGVVVPTTDLVAEAQTAATNAASSATAAATSATDSANSATAAGNSAAAASGSASAASTSETNAASSATSAANSAAAASTTLANTYPKTSMPVLATNVVLDPHMTTTAGKVVDPGTGGAAALSVVAGGPAGATQFVRATWSVASTAPGQVYLSTDSMVADPLTGGSQVFATFMVRCSLAQTVNVLAGFSNAAGWVANSPVQSINVAANTWTPVRIQATVPATATRVNVNALTTTALAAGETIDIAEALVAPDCPAPIDFFAGDSPGAVWSGAANNSTSNLLLIRTDFDKRLGARLSGQVPVADLTQTSGWRFSTHLELEDVGSPEGIKTAPVGSVYRDLAMTNGARQWVKVTGTGNTGWQVSNGDTGWRDLAQWLNPNWVKHAGLSPTAAIRRVNAAVQLLLFVDVAAGATIIGNARTGIFNVLDFTRSGLIDSTFLPMSPMYMTHGVGSFAGSPAYISSSGVLTSIDFSGTAVGLMTAGDALAGHAEWPAHSADGSAPWPTVLPPVAA